jgi:hypothetical protein
MPETLTPRAEEMLDWLPPLLAGDAWVQNIVAAYAAEMQRAEESMHVIRAAMFPASTADVVLPTGRVVYLAQMWELMLGLPVNPEGMTLEDRRATILTCGSGSCARTRPDWVSDLRRCRRRTSTGRIGRLRDYG